MPSGRPARRPSTVLPNVVAAWLGLTSLVGCRALPTTLRGSSPDSEIKARVEGNRPASAVSTGDPIPADSTGPARLAFDRLDEESPLPPALERTRPAQGPSSSRPLDRPEEPVGPAPTPMLDESLARVEAANRAIAEEASKPEGPKPQPTTPLELPIPQPEADPVKVGVPPDPRPLGPTPMPLPEPVMAPAKPAEVATSSAPAEPPKPEDVWREGVQRLRAVAIDRAKAKDSRPGTPNWAIRERLLAWLAEPDIDPDARTARDAAKGRAVLKGFAALLDPGAPPVSRGSEIREAVAALEAETPLEIAELKPCRDVRSFGIFETFEPPARQAGQRVIVYYELSGLAYEPIGPAFRSRHAARVDLIPEGSDKPAWSNAPDTVADHCRRRRRDYFVGYPLQLPDSIPPGPYRLRLTIKDLVSDHEATRETPLTIAR